MVIDILSPVGGRCGGIENVIRAWTKNLPRELYDVRVIHMSPGIKYLEDMIGHMHLVYAKKWILMQDLHILQEIMQDLLICMENLIYA